ncbi:MAG: hypothetical protein U1E86_20495 [Burkholderiaceae bacterium]
MSNCRTNPARRRTRPGTTIKGRAYIRTGDVGRFDADGFLVLFDRKKDMIISGRFNVCRRSRGGAARAPHVADIAVVGVASEQWGETPVASVVPAAGAAADPDEIRRWANGRLGKTQRLAALRLVDKLPHGAIGESSSANCATRTAAQASQERTVTAAAQDAEAVKVFGIADHSGMGKTTLLEAAGAEIASRGRRPFR